MDQLVRDTRSNILPAAIADHREHHVDRRRPACAGKPVPVNLK